MCSKVSAFCIIVFLILFTLSSSASAARPDPASAHEFANPLKTHFQDGEAEKVELEDSCDGIEEEECLMRRTLAAHVDYIYTQKTNP